MASRDRDIYELIRKIPRGRVATYGEVAEMCGIPLGHRVVASALRRNDERADLPWQRVVSKAGRAHATIGIPSPDGHDLQRGMLEAEGVRFDARGRIPLREYGWLWEGE